MNILFFGDVVGRPGRQALQAAVPQLRKRHDVDLVVANVENMAHGFGITPETVAELQGVGVDLFTSGNHIWKNSRGVMLMRENPDYVLRPANFLGEQFGRGFTVKDIAGQRVLLINLQGQVFMDDQVASPFKTFDRIVEEHGEGAVVLVDFHAEATGEKSALGWYIDGRAALLVGTHTHIQTADEKVLPGGMAFISDLGMSGATDSSLGMDKKLVQEKVVHGLNISLEPPADAKGAVASGVLCVVDDRTKKAIRIERIDHRVSL